MNKNGLPQYVTLNGDVGLRLRGTEYFCDGGLWSLAFKVVNGKLISLSDDHEHLDGVELKPSTKEVYKQLNGEYVQN